MGAAGSNAVATTGVVNNQGRVDLLQAAVTGLEAKPPDVLALASNADGSGGLDPVAKFMTNPAGAAVVNALGPLRKAVQGGAAGPRRYLVIAANIDDSESAATVLSQQGPASITVAEAATPAEGFAQRAVVAHAVYSPEQRRPVEVDAAPEDQLVAWLSKRMGAPMKPPHLQAAGYALEGGRLLPGGRGPVAQFMDRDEAGIRLTLSVSNEVREPAASFAAPAASGKNTETAFRFAREGKVDVFHWVEGAFGYAISTDADRAELARVSGEVYRQLNAAPR